MPEEPTQLRMGKIIRDKYPGLDEADQEAVRQHAIAALTLTQEVKKAAGGGAADGAPSAASGGVGASGDSPNTAFVDGVRQFAMSVAIWTWT